MVISNSPARNYWPPAPAWKAEELLALLGEIREIIVTLSWLGGTGWDSTSAMKALRPAPSLADWFVRVLGRPEFSVYLKGSSSSSSACRIAFRIKTN
jgi:hypothetical protein